MTKFEWNFEGHRYSFRPEKNTQQAVLPALKNINDGERFQKLSEVWKGRVIHAFFVERTVAPNSKHLTSGAEERSAIRQLA